MRISTTETCGNSTTTDVDGMGNWQLTSSITLNLCSETERRRHNHMHANVRQQLVYA